MTSINTVSLSDDKLNLIEILSNKIYNALSTLEYCNNDNKWLSNVHYNSSNTCQYIYKNLFVLSKKLKLSIDVIGSSILENMNLDSSEWTYAFKNNFLYFTATPAYMARSIKNLLLTTNPLQIKEQAKTILVDFSSPNIAKDMHVGHLRSTIIGDSICKLFELQGHKVLRINHIGDFGLPFGMLIQYMFDKYTDFTNITISDLQTFYTESKKCFDTDETFKANSYKRVIELQAQSNEDVINVWNIIKSVSETSYNSIYNRLGIKLDEVGESFYQNIIPDLVKELELKNLLIFDEGRYIINTQHGPLTIIKSDGGYTYDTTDLAAIRYRLVTLKVDIVYYVVDVGQSTHFKQIFDVAKLANWLQDDQHAEHISFGLVLDKNNKRFRSRDGSTVKLVDLLDEAVKQVEIVNNTKNRGFDEEYCKIINEIIGYGAIKYADLSTTRTKNYIFSFENMLALKGNTAPFLLYAYVRICSIFRKVKDILSDTTEDTILTYIDTILIDTPEETNLVKHILNYHNIIEKLSTDLMFHNLASYLYELSEHFNRFFTQCRCLNYNDNIVTINYSRLLLCLATKKIMAQIFDILGIKLLDKM
jgi:arginyl-tRNA synthetase